MNGYIQVGKEHEFPFWITDRSVWYTVVSCGNAVSGFTSSKSSKRDLSEYLKLHNDVLLIGVWTGKYYTSLFVLDISKTIIRLGELVCSK